MKLIFESKGSKQYITPSRDGKVHRCCWNISNYLKENKVKLTQKTNFRTLNTKLLAICLNESSEHKLLVSDIYRDQKHYTEHGYN